MKLTARPFTQTLIPALLVTGSVLAAGCDVSEPVSASKPVGSAGDVLLMLGGAPATGSPLDRIAAERSVLLAADLGLSDNPMSEADARQLVAELDGLSLSIGQASEAELEAWKPLTDAALDMGVPVIIDNVADSDRMAKFVGIGFDADLVLVTSLGPNRHRVRVYGDSGILDAHIESSEQAEALAPMFEEDLDLAVDEISTELRDHEPIFASKATPANGYKYYEINFSQYNWAITSSQTAIFDLDFEAELVLDSARSKKNVFIRPIGSGQHPGSLTWDGDSTRGYYQESQKITVTPSNSNVSIYAHAPSTPNSGSTYTSSTGWTIGVSGTDPVLSYSASDETTTTLSDFSTTNHTAGQVASWTFAMSTSWSDMFNHPVFQKCKVNSIPALAKSNLKPEFEVMYRSSSSYTGTTSFNVQIVTVMRKLWRGGDIFTCKKNTQSYTHTRSKSLSINFGAV
ncbi:hypothetical protein [Haliangium sp.]|uniref:hypothetical protein n=1 Tax=Haliangium sp. TaxID=2663208 RepID=UPI003D10B7DB